MVTRTQLVRRGGVAGRERVGIAGREKYRRELGMAPPTSVQMEKVYQRRLEAERERLKGERTEELRTEIAKIDRELAVYSQRSQSIVERLRMPGISGERRNRYEYDLTVSNKNISALSKAKTLLRRGFTAASVEQYTKARVLGWQQQQIAKQAVSIPIVRRLKDLPRIYAGKILSTVTKIPQQREVVGVSSIQVERVPSSAYGYTLARMPTAEEKATMIVPGTRMPGAKDYGVIRGAWEGPDFPVVGTYPQLKKVIEYPFKKLAGVIKKYEEAKEVRGTIYERKVPTGVKEWMKEVDVKFKGFGEVKREKPQEGFSITQKFWEMTGTGFDPKTGKVYKKIKYYKPGEREKIMGEVLTPIREAETYEQQQEAIEQLKDRGIDVILTDEGYKVLDIEKVAPVSVVGTALTGLTDTLFKMGFFTPLIGAGAAQTQEQIKRLSQREQLEIYKKWLREIRGKGGWTQKARQGYAKALASKSGKNIKAAETIIKDLYAQTKAGQKAALKFIRDVRSQEGLVSAASPDTITKAVTKSVFPKPITPQLPVETIGPSAYAGTGMYERYAPSELLFAPIVRKAPTVLDGLGVKNILELDDTKIYSGAGVSTWVGPSTGILEDVGAIQKVLPKVDVKVVPRVIPRVVPRVIPKVTTTQWVGTITAQVAKQKFRREQVFRRMIRPRLRPPRVVPRIGFPVPIPWWLSEEKRRKLRMKRIIRDPLEGGYRVEVRRKGKFIPEIPFAVPRGQALWFGRRAVKRGAAATFRLIPIIGKPRRLGVPMITEKALAIEFRKPKKTEDPLTFIQKRKFRIKTPGEKIEITMKGWAARRGRKEKWL